MMIDEPETVRWGGNITKATLDQMAVYAKSIFPTLPQGLNHGPPGYKWRATERYTKVDYVLYQYNFWVTSGNLVAWRDAVLAQAKLDGVRPALSLNVLSGGKQDKGDGYYDCAGPLQGGLGTAYPNCQDDDGSGADLGQGAHPVGVLHDALALRPGLHGRGRQSDCVQGDCGVGRVEAEADLQAALRPGYHEDPQRPTAVGRCHLSDGRC